MNDSSRRILGLLLGAVIGLVYGLVAQYINVLFLPGLPLQAPATGRLGAALLTALGGGLLGLLAAWPDEAVPGVIASSLVGTLALSWIAVSSTVPGSQRAFSVLVVLFVTFLPRAFLLLPFAGLVRWVIGVWGSELQNVNYSLRRLGSSLLLAAALAAVVGVFSLHAKTGRQALATTYDLVQRGMLAASQDDLPVELRPVDGFIQGARGPYTLELGDNPDVLPIQRPIASYDVQEFAVFVRFENGFRFGCVFTPPNPPACGEY